MASHEPKPTYRRTRLADHAGTPELGATGKRLIPEAYAGSPVLAERLARNRLAARLAAGRDVLAAACAEGYGSAMLVVRGNK